MTITKTTTTVNRTKSTLKGSSMRKQTMSQTNKTMTSTSAIKRVGRSSATFKGDETSAPGSYDVKGMSFGSNTKSMTIGVKRDSRVERSPGPGHYEAQRSDSLTKTRSPQAIDFDRTTGRKEVSPLKDSSAEPGNLERFYQYPKEVPNFTIGELRPEKPKDGPGPGVYNLDDSMTKPRTMGYHKF